MDKKSVRFDSGNNMPASSINLHTAGARSVHHESPKLLSKHPLSPQMSDLSEGDKIKISRLVEKVIELGIDNFILLLYRHFIFICFFEGRQNEVLIKELELSRARRQEDVLNAVSILRAEVDNQSNEIDILKSKRAGALDLLQKYQDKILELVDINRSLTRADAEQKSQLHRFKGELNNMQILLDTQSQTIQSYRLQVSASGGKEKYVSELEEMIQKKTDTCRKQESISRELQRTVDHLNEQNAIINKSIMEKEFKIVELNSLLARQAYSAEMPRVNLYKASDIESESIKVNNYSSSSYSNKLNRLSDKEAKLSQSFDFNEDIVEAGTMDKKYLPIKSFSSDNFEGNDYQRVDYIGELVNLKNNNVVSSYKDDRSTFNSPPINVPVPPNYANRTSLDSFNGSERIIDDNKKQGGETFTAQNIQGVTKNSPETYSDFEIPDRKIIKSEPRSSNRDTSANKLGEPVKTKVDNGAIAVQKKQKSPYSSGSATILASSATRNVIKTSPTIVIDNQVTFAHAKKSVKEREVPKDRLYPNKKTLRSKKSNDTDDAKQSKFTLQPPDTPGGTFAREALSSPLAQNSMYDPAFFDLLDEIDSSTISSISKRDVFWN